MVSTAQDIMSRYGIDQDFAASIESLGNDLGVDPMYLANTMYAESTLNPSEKNKAGSGAMGLIQFMPETAANLGTTTDELSRMTPVEQMEYVRRYFSADNLGAGRLRALRNDPSQHNVNMAVFLPSRIGKPVDTQIPQKYWSQNGSIRTPADYTRSAEERVNAYIQSKPVDAQTDKMLSEEQPEDTFRPEDDSVSSDTGVATGDQAEEEPGFLDTVGEYLGDAYDTASEYVSETVDTLEGVAESVGDKLRRLLGSEEEQSNTSVDIPPLPGRRPERRPVAVDNPPIPKPRPKQADVDFSRERSFDDVLDFVGTLKKAEGGSVEKKVKFVKEDDDDDVPDPPPGATPEEVADDIPAYLSTGEYVLPANVVRYIGLKNITDLHQRALAELQQMEDLDIIENVDENGYVEEDDDEMNYMKPEEAGVVEIVVAEHHPKGLMAMGFAEGGMINSDSSMEEGQVLPTSDIFSEGVYAQANINRSVDSEDVVESDKVITAPVAFSSAPGKTAYLAYITPEEATSLRQAKQGFSSEGNGQEVSDGQYQHLGPKGLMSFNGVDDSGSDGDAEGAAAAAGASADKGGGGKGGGDPGDGHGGGSRDNVEDLEPEDVEEEKPTDPYEGYTYVKGIGYVPTSRRATSNKPIKSASLALSSIFTPGFLGTIGLMGDPNKEL
jgi:hypothetical protein